MNVFYGIKYIVCTIEYYTRDEKGKIAWYYDDRKYNAKIKNELDIVKQMEYDINNNKIYSKNGYPIDNNRLQLLSKEKLKSIKKDVSQYLLIDSVTIDDLAIRGFNEAYKIIKEHERAANSIINTSEEIIVIEQ
jgi:hypothetical protein